MQRRSLLKKLGGFTGGLVFPKVTNALPVPTKSLRIAHVTDTHLQPHLGAARGFTSCLHHIQNHSQAPDFIINGGDAIMGAHKSPIGSYKKQWTLYHEVLTGESSLPIYNCIGNHDIFCKEESTQAFTDGKKWASEELSLSKNYYTINHYPWKIIVLDSIQTTDSGIWYQAKIDEDQMDWLKGELEKTSESQHIMIVSHVPILAACVFFDGKNYKNGEWKIPGSWMHSDAEDLVQLFNKYKNIKLAISGHIHLHDIVKYNDITYCCNGAVSGAWWMGKYKETEPGYAIIDLHENGSFENKYIKYKS